MKQNLRYWVYGITLLSGLTLLACANPVQPTGGPKDETPPRVVEEESTPNLQTNFEKRSFEFTFDEWVKLEDAFNQVVVSPPLEFRPKVTLRKKTVRFEFDEDENLRSDATYTVNFGNAVKDLNQGNVAEDLRFVFSTGDYIDSLFVTGKIVDAFSGEPVPDILFMLYDNLADSVVQKELPFYFAKTDKQGTFRINNVKADTFKVFALRDNNLNYKFDLPNEMIGFADDNIIVSDSVKPYVQLSVFESAQPIRLLDKSLDRYGHVKLVFNLEEPEVNVTFEDVGQSHYLQYEKDTVHLWYDLSDSTGWDIYINADTFLVDTLSVKALSRAKFLTQARLGIGANTLIKSNSQNPYEPMRLLFSNPIMAWDTSAIILLEDTLEVRVQPELSVNEKNKKELVLSYAWKEEMNYALQFNPGAVTDIFGLQNDTITLATRIMPRSQYGNLLLDIKGMKTDVNYIVELLKGAQEISTNHFQSDSTYQHNYGAMLPGKYSVRIIEDKNKNKRWDPGNYDLKTQPERLFFRNLDELRAGWDLESEVSVGQ